MSSAPANATEFLGMGVTTMSLKSAGAPLSEAQRQAARLSAIGLPRHEIARRVGRSLRQVHRWHERESFVGYVDVLRYRVADEFATELVALALHGIEVIHDVLNERDVEADSIEVARQAIEWVLDRMLPASCTACGNPIRHYGGDGPKGWAP